MPNHVINRVRVTGDERDVSRFVSRVIQTEQLDSGEKETVFDFNQIVQMPEDIRDAPESIHVSYGLALQGYLSDTHHGFSPSIHKVGKAQALQPILEYSWVKEAGITRWQDLEKHLREQIPTASGLGRKAVENYETYGHMSWYSWSIAHWGTKWGAYQYREEERSPGVFECTFDTAWSPPVPIYEAIALRFPTIHMVVHWFDEGWCHAGKIILDPEDGFVVEEVVSPDPETNPHDMELYAASYGHSFANEEGFN